MTTLSSLPPKHKYSPSEAQAFQEIFNVDSTRDVKTSIPTPDIPALLEWIKAIPMYYSSSNNTHPLLMS
ncbi:hypothetical protein WG66_001294 [Moniliophthora roreri]|nr:hypothetical protein WG66_001294 [Moniliophthora roreri]